MKKIIQLTFTIFLGFIFFTAVHSSEEIIKGRKAIFSKNYKTAKAVSIAIKAKDFSKAKDHLKEMSENYNTLLKYFPENSKTGFKTEALPSIWENSDEFITLMKKASSDVLILAQKLDSNPSDLKSLQKKFL